MMRRVGLIYRRDKSLSKAALGFIEVTLLNAGTDLGSMTDRGYGRLALRTERDHGKCNCEKRHHFHRNWR